MDTITENFCKADILFGLRPALEKFGFSETEDIYLVFEHKGKDYKTGPIPPVTSGRTSSLNDQNIKAAISDWLNKTEMQLPFNKAVGEKIGIKDENGEHDVTVRFVSDSNEYALSGKFYWPCYPFGGPCCFR